MDRHARGARSRDPRTRREGRHFRHNQVATTRRLFRLGALVLTAAVVAAVIASSASTALFFLFKPTTAKPGDIVTVRKGGTPASFTLAKRKKPFQRPIRVYLVPNRLADEVHNRFDARLHFIGSLVPDRNGRGVLTFTVPALDTDDYAAAAWCPACAQYSFGRTFSILRVREDTAPRYRPLMLLRVEMPSATESCPVTVPRGGKPPRGLGAPPPYPGFGTSPRWHANGFLWTALPLDGVYAPGRQWVEPDGSVGAKLYWFADGVDGEFTLKGQRIDAVSPPLVVDRVNRGWTPTRGSGTWATPVTFPSAGCWKLTARVKDISLSFVLRVTAG